MDLALEKYINQLVNDIVKSKQEIQTKIFMSRLPGLILPKGTNLLDVYTRLGFTEETIKKHLVKGIKRIDKSIIENNPYYKNISLKTIKERGVTVNPILFSENEIDIVEQEYIEDKCIQIPLAVHNDSISTFSLQQHGETWMSVTHNEILTVENNINKAEGNVFTAGLGLGYFAYMCAIKESVKSVTIVEIQDEVIKIFEKYILSQFGDNAFKIKIIKADYFDYIRKNNLKEKFDYSFIDIYFNPMHGLPTYEISQEILHEQEGEGIVEFWLEQNFEFIVREALLLAVAFKRVQNKSNYECIKACEPSTLGNNNRNMYIKKAISYIENMKIKCETPEDIDRLILNKETKLYKEIAAYKNLLCFDKFEIKPKVKNKASSEKNNNLPSRKKKLSKKQRQNLKNNHNALS